jgi:hypothetical protein
MDADPIFVGEGDIDAARALVEEAEAGELFLYPGDQHYFADSSLPSYDPDAAALLTRRVLEFLWRRQTLVNEASGHHEMVTTMFPWLRSEQDDWRAFGQAPALFDSLLPKNRGLRRNDRLSIGSETRSSHQMKAPINSAPAPAAASGFATTVVLPWAGMTVASFGGAATCDDTCDPIGRAWTRAGGSASDA